MKPLVTVTIAAYNHAPFIRKALDRLSAQTLRDFKIVACDDGSTDGTFDILKEYESSELAGRLVVYTHPGHKNLGIQSTRARCLQCVDSEFFIGHASDDYWEPDALEYLVGMLRREGSPDFAYGRVNVVDENGNDLPYISGNVDIGFGLAAAEQLMLNNDIRAPSIMYRHTCLDIALAVPPHICFSDWYQNVLLFLERKPCFYNRPVVNYRVHSTNASIGRSNEYFVEKQNEVFRELLINQKVVSNPTLRAFLLCRLAENLGSSESVGRKKVELSAALVKIPEKKDRKRVVISCLSRTSPACNRHGLMSVLPMNFLLSISLRICPAMAFRQAKSFFVHASLRCFLCFLGLLISSLALLLYIVLRSS